MPAFEMGPALESTVWSPYLHTDYPGKLVGCDTSYLYWQFGGRSTVVPLSLVRSVVDVYVVKSQSGRLGAAGRCSN